MSNELNSFDKFFDEAEKKPEYWKEKFILQKDRATYWQAKSDTLEYENLKLLEEIEKLKAKQEGK